ncbi:MAG: NusG domain II-containing protein [Clostridia bacterium]|nr:NusG domain II-containing protein [Clostridia bacterium]
MKKADYIVCGVVCFIAAALAVLFMFIKSDGETVVVKENNEIIAEYPLDVDRRVALDNNTFIIDSGSVYMSEANCKNQTCVKTGKISKKGECIVCLPNKVIIEIR